MLACATWCSACAATPAAFSARYPDNVEDDLALLVQRVQSAPPRTEASIAVGVTAAPKQLYAYDLAAKHVLWRLPSETRFAPLLAGEVVVTQEANKVVGREQTTGQTRFSIDSAGMTLNGADGEGQNVVLVLTTGAGTYAKSNVLLMQGGAVRWKRQLNASAGSAALVGKVVLVPWSGQYLSALTIADGNEFARLRVHDAVLGHAFVAQGKAFLGSEHGVGQLTQEIVSGKLQTGAYLAAPTDDLPGRPLFMRDVYATTPMAAPESAQNRIRMTWLPALRDAHHIELAGGNLYLMFYRFVFALHPGNLSLHWVYAHDRDLVGARAQPDGLAIADVHGGVGFLAARSGQRVWFEDGAQPTVDMELPTAGGPQVSGDGGNAPDPDALRKQLLAAAQDADARLVPMRLLAVELLAKLDDEKATANLLGLCEDERTTAPVRKAACTALQERKSGTEHLLAALERHAAYLEGTTAPPVGALAKAAAAQQEKRAVPLLIAHLNDPATPPQTLPAVVSALADLGDTGAAPSLATFLRFYHADPVDEYVARTLELIPDALVKLQGPAARETLVAVADDTIGTGTVRDRAKRALAALDDQTKAAEKNEDAQRLAEEQEAAKLEAASGPKRQQPAHITVDIIKETLLPVRQQLQSCVQKAKPETFQARLVLVIEDGQVLMVSVMPEHLQSCIEPLIRSRPFPTTQISKRERLSYTIKR